MIIRAYLPQILTTFFGGLFVALGIITFGNAEAFDKLYLLILFFAALLCHKNMNIVSILSIILLQRLTEELAWLYLFDNNIIKLLIYCFGLLAAYYLRHDWLVKVIIPTIVLVIVAEAYWFISDYKSPELYWHIWIMISNLIVRFLIFSRVSLVDHYFPNKGESVNLDWVIYKLSVVVIIIQSAILFEYLIRHILGVSGALYIYLLYPYLIHGLATIAIWATFQESYKQILPKLLKA
jgi:hypothetical protein